MLPREFLMVYGQPVVRRLSVTIGNDVIVQADADRYLLGFWWSSVNVGIHPDMGDLQDADFMYWPVAPEPLLFTHALHGALVNLAWRLHVNGANTTVTVIEGFMRQVRQPRNKR